ncbi:hypothetical protein JCM10908_001423 [Rhodotorula pacifica]|uniref:uncharacterized protein n=1 Tax=Rhodotorula pacifica TaxID=1495444 RepID=UPI0031776B24
MAPTATSTLLHWTEAAPESPAFGLKAALRSNPRRAPSSAIAPTTANPLSRPPFDALPLRPGDPYASAWGLYGPSDELGTLNSLGPDLVRQGMAEIRSGKSFSLALPLDVPRRAMNPARAPAEHTLICKGHANDDSLNFNTQTSSHWDGLRHYPYQKSGLFYNGVTQENLTEPTCTRIGIQNIAERPIFTSAVLIDFARYASQHDLSYSAFTTRRVTLSELTRALRSQGTKLQAGDVLLIRFGWTQQYLSLSPDEQDALGRRTGEERAHVGVDASTDEIARWIWEEGVIAVASDTNAFEAQPFARFGRSSSSSSTSSKQACARRACDVAATNATSSSETDSAPQQEEEEQVALHEVLLSGWGMPIGELWALEALSEECHRTGLYRFCLSSAPLNLPGGVASPPNAIAIL